MRNLKKVLALALASVMLMGMMVVGTSAASDAAGHANEEAIEVVKLIGVMAGDENGNFNPEKGVTRNEMAVIMVNLLDLKLNGSHPFTDVPAWADKFVGAVYTNGYTSGTSATTFGGNDALTAAQAALMVMKTLGYFEFAGEFGADWKLATVKKATELELFKDIEAGVDEALTRAEAAQLVFNALKCKTVIVTEKGGMKVEGNGLSVSQAAEYTYTEGKTLEAKLFSGLKKLANSTDDLGRVTTEYTFKPEKGDLKELSIPAKADYTVVLTKDYASGKLADLVDYVLDNTYSKLNADAAIAGGKTMWNGAQVADLAALNAQVASVGEAGVIVELFVNADDAKLVDAIVAYSYDLKQITKIDTKVKEADAEDGVKAYVTMGGKVYNDNKIPGFVLADYAKDDFIAVCYGKGGAVVDTYAPEIVKNVSFTSIASSLESAKVGATSYTGTGLDQFKLDDKGTAISVGTDNVYDLYLDANGYVLDVKAVETKKTLDDVYYVLNAFKNNKTDDYNVTTTKAYVQVVDLAGVISNVEVEYTTVGEDNNTAKALVGKLVTFKSVKDKDYKAATEYDFTADKNFDKVASPFSGKIESSTKQIAGAYLKADTQYILIDTLDKDNNPVALGKITAEAKAGITGYNLANAIVITAKEGTAVVAKYVIVKDVTTIAATYEDKLYVNSSAYSVTEDGNVFTVYNAKGEKVEILCDELVTSLTAGFNTYTVEDGEYKLTGSAASALTADTTWKKEIKGAFAGDYVSFYNGMLTVKYGSYKLIDIAAADVVVVDLVDDDVAITTLAELETAVNDTDNKTLTGVKVAVDVAETGAVILFVTAATEL